MASATQELVEGCSHFLQNIFQQGSLILHGNSCGWKDVRYVENSSIPATPTPAEAIALLAAPELPPPPRALRGACIQ